MPRIEHAHARKFPIRCSGEHSPPLQTARPFKLSNNSLARSFSPTLRSSVPLNAPVSFVSHRQLLASCDAISTRPREPVHNNNHITDGCFCAHFPARSTNNARTQSRY